MNPDSITQTAGESAGTGAAVGAQFLTFYLAGQVYGINILKVQEVRALENVRELPHMPVYLKGVLDLRGVLIPVIGLRELFELGAAEMDSRRVVVIVSAQTTRGSQTLGLIVDAVSDVVEGTPENSRAIPDMGAGCNVRYLDGMIVTGQGQVALLNSDVVLAGYEIPEVQIAGRGIV